MKHSAWVSRWERLVADMSIAAATLAVAYAATGSPRDVASIVLAAWALVGFAWVLERNADGLSRADSGRSLLRRGRPA